MLIPGEIQVNSFTDNGGISNPGEFLEVPFTDNGEIPNLGEILTDKRGEKVVFVMNWFT